ncbi:multivesicular body subunit 12A isoform X2 [Spea bombifrons]|uniref:multivesicular body subunit 12A isoform X2 n=1 Tax=Spea bombifrons TaxID=233779 RepID=UPI0023498DF4|nr:multivesicular body subunit 12A isoform X2 [Spea bombifrons]
MEESSKPLTGLAWASGQSLCPKGYTMIVATSEGASANFVKGFNQKSAIYLCYSSAPESLEQVVTDIQLLNEKNSLPVGYAYIGEYTDTRVSASKKKRLCVKLLPLNSADFVVCEIKITMKNNKIGAPYTRVGDISGLGLWCKKVSASEFKPTPKPRNITSGIRGLSLDSGSPAPNPTEETPALKPTGRSPLTENAKYDSANIYGISAIDGIPFTIHPMFENKIGNSPAASSGFADFRVKTLSEIEDEYNYGFAVERSAAARMPPGVC